MNKAKHTLLIVEDNAINREMLGDILASDYSVVYAENGQVALEKMRENAAISLVLLDLHMPVMGGIEVLDAMAEDDRLKDIPVIVVTANDSFYEEEECLEHGALDFISKPYDPAIVRLRIGTILRILAPMREVREKMNLMQGICQKVQTQLTALEDFAEHMDDKQAAKSIVERVENIFCDIRSFK